MSAQRRRRLSKGAQFEIFKRDKFTCQYCGAKAPDVVLHVDHIEPLSAGGSNDILNLITACQNCNAGKSNRRLSETQRFDKKRAQLELLQDRRESMQMLCRWQQELAHLSEEAAALLEEIFKQRTRLRFSRRGRSDVKKWIASYGFECVLQSMHDSLGRYYQPSKKRGENSKSAEEAFSRVLHLIQWQDREKRDPDRARFLRIKRILRTRFSHISWRELEQAIKTWRSRELPAEELADIANRSPTWPNFRAAVAAKCNETSKDET